MKMVKLAFADSALFAMRIANCSIGSWLCSGVCGLPLTLMTAELLRIQEHAMKY